mmetsp:Transcript_24498/g.92561  ORF Transcript_24498/g.92561 Transcript_24498/m.92561 type:complete len:331 (-) Transcript_24498:622-1614(-)
MAAERAQTLSAQLPCLRAWKRQRRTRKCCDDRPGPCLRLPRAQVRRNFAPPSLELWCRASCRRQLRSRPQREQQRERQREPPPWPCQQLGTGLPTSRCSCRHGRADPAPRWPRQPPRQRQRQHPRPRPTGPERLFLAAAGQAQQGAPTPPRQPRRRTAGRPGQATADRPGQHRLHRATVRRRRMALPLPRRATGPLPPPRWGLGSALSTGAAGAGRTAPPPGSEASGHRHRARPFRQLPPARPTGGLRLGCPAQAQDPPASSPTAALRPRPTRRTRAAKALRGLWRRFCRQAARTRQLAPRAAAGPPRPPRRCLGSGTKRPTRRQAEPTT